MKRFPKFLLALLVALALAGYWEWKRDYTPHGEQKVAFIAANRECGSGGKARPWRYCVYTSRSGDNGNIAYYFHGRNLDENAWNDDTYYTAMIQGEWSRRGLRPPRVVAVSFGPLWLLTNSNGKPKTGLLDIFVQEVAPEIERKIGAPNERLVFGESMGGINALLLAILSPGFATRAAALCPPLYAGSPFVSSKEVRAFLQRTGADPKIIYGLRRMLGDYADNEAQWQNISPVALVSAARPLPRLYVSCGLYDKYGAYEGAQYFARTVESHGAKIEWHPLYGGHCVIDVPSLARFLAE